MAFFQEVFFNFLFQLTTLGMFYWVRFDEHIFVLKLNTSTGFRIRWSLNLNLTKMKICTVSKYEKPMPMRIREICQS